MSANFGCAVGLRMLIYTFIQSYLYIYLFLRKHSFHNLSSATAILPSTPLPSIVLGAGKFSDPIHLCASTDFLNIGTQLKQTAKAYITRAQNAATKTRV